MSNFFGRRKLLQSAPLAAAALVVGDASLVHALAPALGGEMTTPAPFQVITADQLQGIEHEVQTTPGNHTVVEGAGVRFTMVVTTEVKKAAKEFEYHEGRDHIFQILDGSTKYEVGGTPQNPRQTKPGEWLAPGSTGSTAVMLYKGDTIVIPRGTPHKRTTESSVTFILISPEGK